ncbi:MAG: alpha/beta hydrolase [Pseudomonadota bacterium]
MLETIEIEARGMRFTADIAGPERGELVVMLHGFPQTRHTWRHEIPVLAKAGYRVCAPDQRGYSAGARPQAVEDYVLANLVDDVLGIAAALGHEQFHLVGHDWGGGVAWTTAALNQDAVTTLAVISRPHPRAFARALEEDPEQSRKSSHHRTNRRSEATDEMLANGQLAQGLLNAGVPPQAVDTYVGTLGDRAALDAAINWYRALGVSSGLKGKVGSVGMPTLYVWGNADGSVGRHAAEATADFVEGPYRFVELTDVGHFVTDQVPQVFPPLLLDHLSSRAGRDAS